MFFFDRAGQHDDFAPTLRKERKAAFRCTDFRHAPQHPAETPYFHPQTRSMRLIDESCSECSRQELIS
jgi:hypothetical protein